VLGELCLNKSQGTKKFPFIDYYNQSNRLNSKKKKSKMGILGRLGMAIYPYPVGTHKKYPQRVG
jgi:hypothetical protein